MNIIIIAFVCFCFIKSSVGQKYLSYVCHSFFDYKITRALNPDCYYSGDVLGSFEEIAHSYGYNTQVYEVITEDQYILTVFRISSVKSTSVGSPVLLTHGGATASTAYVLVGNHSLAFLLADEGYDVWVCNLRGTSYSQKHAFLNVHDRRYWDFTFQEYGNYDIKSIINFVASTSKQKVIFIGWSTGATAYLIYNILNPDEAIQNVRVSVLLAPVIYFHLVKTPLSNVLEVVPYWMVKKIMDQLYPEGVLYLKTPALVKLLLHFCLDNPSQALFCELAIGLIVTGLDIQQQKPETFPVLAAQSTEATGLKIIYHGIQLIKSKKLQQFDYGEATNLLRYGTPHPPLYNLSLLNLPMYLIHGSNDLLSTPESTNLAYHDLPEVTKPFGMPYRVQNDKFCHSDMVAARDIKTLLNDHIIEFLKKNVVYFNN